MICSARKNGMVIKEQTWNSLSKERFCVLPERKINQIRFLKIQQTGRMSLLNQPWPNLFADLRLHRPSGLHPSLCPPAWAPSSVGLPRETRHGTLTSCCIGQGSSDPPSVRQYGRVYPTESPPAPSGPPPAATEVRRGPSRRVSDK